MQLSDSAAADIPRCWRLLRDAGVTMYSSEGDYRALVQQALGRDIRSAHHRALGPPQPGGSRLLVPKDSTANSVSPDKACSSVQQGPNGSIAHDAQPPDMLSRPNEVRVESYSGTSEQQQPGADAVKVPLQRSAPNSQDKSAAAVGKRTHGYYHIVLEGVDITYDVDSAGAVQVQSAQLWEQREHVQST